MMREAIFMYGLAWVSWWIDDRYNIKSLLSTP